MTKTCKGCSRIFTTKGASKEFCPKCVTSRARTDREKQRGFASSLLNVGEIGAIAELLVCADLLQKDFEVFRSVSAHTSCDIIALSDSGQTFRVEVKTSDPGLGCEFYTRGLDPNLSEIQAYVVHNPRGHKIYYRTDNDKEVDMDLLSRGGFPAPQEPAQATLDPDLW